MTGGDVRCPDLPPLQGIVTTEWAPCAPQSALVPRADVRPRSGLRLATASPHPPPEHLWPPAPSPSAPGSTPAPRSGGPRNTHGPDGQGSGWGEVFPRETGGPLGLGECSGCAVWGCPHGQRGAQPVGGLELGRWQLPGAPGSAVFLRCPGLPSGFTSGWDLMALKGSGHPRPREDRMGAV